MHGTTRSFTSLPMLTHPGSDKLQITKAPFVLPITVISQANPFYYNVITMYTYQPIRNVWF